MVYTTAGLELLASLGAGAQLTITRCMVGTGKVKDVAEAMALTDLVQPLEAATSTKPLHKNNECSLIIEYRNDLNGGLDYDAEITEAGVWAQTGSNAEVLLLTLRMEDHPNPISAYTPGGAIDIRRWPVTVAVSNDCTVVLGCNALALMTAEDVTVHCMEVVLPQFLVEVENLIAAHNASLLAHSDLRALIDKLLGKINMLELQLTTDVTGNQWEVSFDTLDGLIVTGVWNKAQARLEW